MPLVAVIPQPNAPVDLTGNTFVTGNAKAYAGGVTSSGGTNTTPVYTREVYPNATPHVQARTPDRSSSVALRNPSARSANRLSSCASLPNVLICRTPCKLSISKAFIALAACR